MRAHLAVLVLAAAAVAPAAAPAAAQEPMTLRVQPGAVDDLAAAARAREALVERRMREADYLFRNICVRCGGVERPGSLAPFDPMGSLDRRRR